MIPKSLVRVWKIANLLPAKTFEYVAHSEPRLNYMDFDSEAFAHDASDAVLDRLKNRLGIATGELAYGLGEDGPTHQAVEQLARPRAIPGLTLAPPSKVRAEQDQNNDAIEHRWRWP